MPRKSYPFGRGRKGYKGQQGQRSSQSDNSSQGSQFLLQPSLSRLETALLYPEVQSYRFCLIYDQEREELEFMRKFSEEMNFYRATAAHPLPQICLGIYQIPMSSLKQAVREEGCSRDEFIQSELLLIYKIEPCASVVAVGPEAQRLLESLKAAAADRPDRGERFLLLDDVIEPVNRIACHGDPQALQRLYRQTLIRRIYS